MLAYFKAYLPFFLLQILGCKLADNLQLKQLWVKLTANISFGDQKIKT